jgi:hypothetical protein
LSLIKAADAFGVYASGEAGAPLRRRPVSISAVQDRKVRL